MKGLYVIKKEQLYKIKSRQPFKFKCVKCGEIYHVSKNRFKPHNIPRFSTFLCYKCYKEYNKSLSLDTNTLPIIKNIEDFNKLKIDKPFRYICKNCGKLVIIRSFRRYRIKDYSRFLCKSCYCELVAKENPEIIEKRRKTVLNKYGISSISKLQWVRQKIKSVKLERYGNPYYTNRKKSYETFRKNHNGMSLQDYNKTREAKNNLSKIKTAIGYPKPYNHYNYYGIRFDSKPELAVWIYCIDHDIPIIREPCILKYTKSDGSIGNYVPDFMVNGELVEIKGPYLVDESTDTWIYPNKVNSDSPELKHQCAIQNNVKILYKNDYIKYLEYVRDKYSNILYDMYDINNPYNPSYWCYYIPYTNNIIKDYYNNSNYIKGCGISPYDINKDSEYTVCRDSKGVYPIGFKKIY